MELIDWIMLGLLGVMILFIGLNMLWGFLRGLRKSAFRLTTVVCALILAFFLAPVFGGIFASITLPGVGSSVEELFFEQLGRDNNSDLYNAIADFPELYSAANGVAPAIMSLLAFIILFWAFLFLTWIVYLIFRNKVAPNTRRSKRDKKTKNGMDISVDTPAPRRRWWGMLVGFTQGVLLFFFFAIPINGAIALLNTVDSHQPDFARQSSINALYDRDFSGNAELFNTLRDWNQDIQSTPFSLVTRYTGMQFLAGPMLGYLTTIQTDSGFDNINLRSDIISANQAFRNFHAVYAAVSNSNSDFSDAMQSLPVAYFNGMRYTIETLFDIGVLRLALNSASGLADFLEEWGVIDLELAIPADDASQDDLTRIDDLNTRFNASVIATIGQLTSIDGLRNDALALVDIAQTLFQSTREFDGNHYNLYTVLGDVFYYMSYGDTTKIQIASNRMNYVIAPTTQDNLRTSLAFSFFQSLFSLNVFDALDTTDPESATADVVRVPLIVWLGLDDDALVEFEFGDELALELTNILVNAGQAFVAIAQLMDALDTWSAFYYFDNYDIDDLANMLDSMTNGSVLEDVLRDAILNYINDNFDYAEDSTRAVLEQLRGELAAGTTINWHERLAQLQYSLG